MKTIKGIMILLFLVALPLYLLNLRILLSLYEKETEIKIEFLTIKMQEPKEEIQINSITVTEVGEEHQQNEYFKFHIEEKSRTKSFKPISYGFTYADARNTFKPVYRRICTDPNIFSLLANGSVQVNCNWGDAIGIEVSNIHREKLGKIPYEYRSELLVNNKVLSPVSEFHYAKCNDGRSDVYLRNVKNSTVSDRCQRDIDKWKAHYHTESFRPLNVFNFFIDSASRNLRYRNLPKLMNLFREIMNDTDSNYVVYDFLLNNAIKAFTVPNLIPLTLGISKESFDQIIDDEKSNLSSDIFPTLQRQKALWSHFRKMGFVTAFSSDATSGFLSEVYGSEVLVDHPVHNFWRVGKEIYGLDEFKDDDVCLGSYYSHYYSLSYIKQFIKNYTGFNKYMFVLTLLAHEGSGTRLSVADDDFVEFFEETLKSIDTSKEDFVFFIGGDHGTSKGDFISIEGLAERVLTSQFIIANKELIKRLNSSKYLSMNSKLPISRYDIYKTMKFLAYAPYTNLQVNSKEYCGIRTEYTSFSLFHEVVDEGRTCSDLGVSDSSCVSKRFENTDKRHYSYPIFDRFITMGVDKINIYLKQKMCPEITKYEIINIEELAFSPAEFNKSVNYIIWMNIGYDPKSIFLMHAVKGDQNQFNNLQEMMVYGSFERILLKKVNEVNYFTIEMLLEIYRLGPLLTVEDFNKISNCEYKLRMNHNLFLSEKEQTCLEVCESISLECNRPIFYDSILEYLFSLYGRKEIIGKYDSIEVENEVVLVGRWHNCWNKPHGQGVCFCSLTNVDPWHK